MPFKSEREMEVKKIGVRQYHWQVIINPNALSGKCGEFWKEISEILTNSGITYQEHFACHIHAGWSIAENLSRKGERHFIIIGGDGTVNEVINGIVSSGIKSRQTFIVPFPVGTGNDWVHTHNYPQNFRDILPPFLNGYFKAHDVGLVETIQNGQITDRRYFINIAGFCFDAEVIYETTKGKHPLFASATYVWSLLKVLFRYKSQTVVIKTENEYLEKKIFTIAVGIGKYNGNGMMQVPMANPFDGLFDLVLIEKISILKVIANVRNLFAGKHIDLKEVSIIRCKEVEIIADPPVLGETEGEMLRRGNYRITSLPAAIYTLMIPENKQFSI